MDTKDVVLRFVELINKKRINLLDEVMAQEYILHIGTKGEIKGLPLFKRVNSTEGGAIAFPDFEIDVVDTICEGDRVVMRYVMRATSRGSFMGHTATGERVSWSGIAIHRVWQGKMVESWTNEDTLSLFLQLKIFDISSLK